MSENQKTAQGGLPTPPVAPFIQQPSWNHDSQIVVTGREFETMYNFIAMFGPAVDAARRTLSENLQSGVIVLKHLNEKGEEVSADVVEKFNAEMIEYRQKLNAAVEAMGGKSSTAPTMQVHKTDTREDDTREESTTVEDSKPIEGFLVPKSEANPETASNTNASPESTL